MMMKAKRIILEALPGVDVNVRHSQDSDIKEPMLYAGLEGPVKLGWVSVIVQRSLQIISSAKRSNGLYAVLLCYQQQDLGDSRCLCIDPMMEYYRLTPFMSRHKRVKCLERVEATIERQGKLAASERRTIGDSSTGVGAWPGSPRHFIRRLRCNLNRLVAVITGMLDNGAMRHRQEQHVRPKDPGTHLCLSQCDSS